MSRVSRVVLLAMVLTVVVVVISRLQTAWLVEKGDTVRGEQTLSPPASLAIPTVPLQAPSGRFREAVLKGIPLVVEYAETAEQKAQGLSGRDSLPENGGMLFPYAVAGLYGIWMKEMRFPLDIIWFDEEKKIVTIVENVLPSSYPQVFVPTQKSHYILEVNAGFVRQQGIALGDVLEMRK